VEAPGVEPCRRYNEKPKRCADLHKVHAELDASERVRLRAVGIDWNRVKSGRLGDRWATIFRPRFRGSRGRHSVTSTTPSGPPPRQPAVLARGYLDRPHDDYRGANEAAAQMVAKGGGAEAVVSAARADSSPAFPSRAYVTDRYMSMTYTVGRRLQHLDPGVQADAPLCSARSRWTRKAAPRHAPPGAGGCPDPFTYARSSSVNGRGRRWRDQDRSS
jgi:hypothetical protein